MEPLIAGLILGVLSLLAYWVWRYLQVFKTFEKLGIPGPRPVPLVGTNQQMVEFGFCSAYIEWCKQYGKVYGTYNASQPVLVVCDLDLLQDVMVKRFSCFRNRPFRPFSDFIDFKPWIGNLFTIKDDHWKHVRSALSPAFSGTKLKKMTPAIHSVIHNMKRYIGEVAEKGKEVELNFVTNCISMDIIAGVAFGMEVDTLSNPTAPFSVHGQKIVDPTAWYLPLLLTFPALIPVLRVLGLSLMSVESSEFLSNILDLAIRDRRQDKKSFPDFLQLLVDAEKEGHDVRGLVDAEIDHSDQLKTSDDWHRKSHSLTDDEIKANALMFLFAGYNTSSIALSFTLFHIAANPDVLRKAQEEVDIVLGKNLVTFDTASQLTYMDMCLSETVRLNPPCSVVDRGAAEDTMLGNYPIKKGLTIMIPVYAIHRDPQYWPDPDRFDPERHSPEAKATRHPFSYMPFGLGPRNCIGMRLAQLVIRMVLATILQNSSPVLCDKSVYPPVVKPPELPMAAKDGLWIKFKPRS